VKVLLAGGGTGGHLIPALALADALCDLDPDVNPIIVGAQRGVEATLLPNREPNYPFVLLPVEPIYRRQWWRNVRWFSTIRRLRQECRRIIQQERPEIAVGTGGYAAGPILFYAERAGVPLAVQEQNALPGLTTRLLAGRARQIHLGFAEAESRLRLRRGTEVFASGNPISPPPSDLAAARVRARAELGIDEAAQVSFVMGGSQGARGINRALAAALDAGLLDDVVVLWSTGHGHFDRYGHHHAPPARHVRPFWDPVATAYAASDVAITRAGAMTTAELCAWGLPAVLIPLPTSAADHQTVNAETLERAGAAIHLPEADLGSGGGVLADRLLGVLRSNDTLSTMANVARSRGRPHAAKEIATNILTLAR